MLLPPLHGCEPHHWCGSRMQKPPKAFERGTIWCEHCLFRVTVATYLAAPAPAQAPMVTPLACPCRGQSKTSPTLACAPCGRWTARLRRSLLTEGKVRAGLPVQMHLRTASLFSAVRSRVTIQAFTYVLAHHGIMALYAVMVLCIEWAMKCVIS